MLDDARPSLRMQRIGRFARDRDQPWPIRVPVLPVAAARSSQLPAGALDTPDRLLDLDGHAWTVGSGADGPGVRRATASATSRLAHHGTSPTAAFPRSPSHQQAIALSQLANPQLPAHHRLPPAIARRLPLLPQLLRACPPAPPPRLACRRLASRRLRDAWACLTRFLRQVEEGVSSASAVDTPSSKPRRGAKSESEARRRPGDLLRPSARDHHLETTTRRRGCTRLSPECALLVFAMQQSRPGRRPLQLTALPLRLDAGRRGSSGSRPVSVEA